MSRLRLLALFLFVLAGAGAAAIAAAGGASSVGTCTIYWTGATSTAWNTGTNWSFTDGGPSAGGTPGASDFVCMSTAPTRSAVVAASGTRGISGIRFNATASVTPSLTLQGGTFTLNTNDSVINNLSATGIVNGSATLTMTGTGTLNSVVLIGATKTVDAAASYSSTSTITVGETSSSSAFAVAGALTVSGGSLQISAATSGLAPNSVTVGGTLALNNSASVATAGSGVVKPTLVSTGTVTAGGNNRKVINVAFSSTGSVAVSSGALALNLGPVAGAPDVGNVSVAAGCTLEYVSGARTIGTLTSAGTVLVSGATITFPASTAVPTVSVSNGGATFQAGARVSGLTVSGGTISGSPTVGALTATGGSFSGSGTTTLTGSSAVCGVRIADGHRLLNQGTATYNKDCGYVDFQGGGSFENAGSLTMSGASGAANFRDSDGNPDNAVLNDAGGSITVALTGGASVGVQINVPFSNAGTVTISTGRLALGAGPVSSGADTGTFAIADGAQLSLNGGSRTIGASTITGGGVFAVTDGIVTVSAGVLLSNLTLSGGTVLGSPSIAALTATAGTFSGGGVTTLTGSTSSVTGLTLSGGYRLLNSGSLTLRAGNAVSLKGGSQFENAGSFTVSGPSGSLFGDDGNAANLVMNDPGANVVVDLVNSASYVTVSPKFSNSGTVSARTGTMRLSAVTNLSSAGVLTGGSWVAAGGSVGFPRTVTANGAAVNLGTTGGFVVGSSTTAALAPLASNSGSLTIAQNLTGSASVSNSGTVTASAGTWQVNSYTQTSGSTTLATGAVLKSGATGTANVAINGGVLTGTGTVQGAVTGVGTVQPGTAGSGSLTVTGTWTAAAGTTLAVSAGATSTSLAVSGAAVVDGTLAVTTVSPTPAVGTTVTVLSAASRTGTFANVTGTDVPGSSGYWSVGYTSTSVTLTFVGYPSVSVSGGSVVEGNSGTAVLPFTVSLSAASAQTVTVAYATSDGTAAAGSDYTAASGTLTFAPGTTTQAVNVSVAGDTLYENDETVILTLTSPSSATLGTATSAGTVVNDDAAPAVSVGAAGGTVGAGSGATLIFPVTLSAPSGLDVTVAYATSDGTALSPVDYTATSGTLTIPAGSTTASISVSAPSQAGYAPPKTFTVTLSSPTNATLGSASATGTISNSNPSGGTPSVASVSPSSGAANTTVAVVINGQNLPSNASVVVSGNGVAVSNVQVSTTSRITATFTIAAGAAVGARNVTVNGTGGPATCTGCFTVTARPSVTAFSRTAFAAGNVDAQVDLTGAGYTASTTVRFVKGAKSVEATSVNVDSATALTAWFTLANNTPVGTWSVVLTNADGGTTACANCVTVYAAPKITAVSPSSVVRGTSTAMTFTGTGFVTGARVSVQGATLSNVVVVNATTITATVTFPSGAAAGSKTVKVFNPASAGSGTGALAAAITVTTG